MKQQLKHQVFWLPFIFLAISTILSITHKTVFLAKVVALKQWILEVFGGLFSWTAFVCVLLIVVIYFSPIAKIRIGGKNAQPLFSKWRWFAITLCTTIATGILFWGTAEPLYHLHNPPQSLGIEAGSLAAQNFAMSTMYMHWTITPYSIYCIMGLLFGLVYYNLKRPFSLGSMLYPLFGKSANGSLSHVIDILCLFALVAGMAASLGAGILSISGGLQQLFGITGNILIYGLIAFLVVLAFTLSAGSGLMKGIRVLSDFNIKAFIVLAILLFVFLSPIDTLKIGWSGLVDYVQHFFGRSTNLIDPLDRPWSQSWTTFYWSNWMAWAPISALFLGRIAYGYTVRQFIHVNLLLTAAFSALWMMIFSGSTLHYDMTIGSFPLFQSLETAGPESIIYILFKEIPLSGLISFGFLLIAFLSIITASDSITSAMSGISSTGIDPDHAEAPFYIKVVWGITIGLVGWIMVSYAGIDGIKTISAIGGLPTLFLTVGILLAWARILLKPGVFEETE